MEPKRSFCEPWRCPGLLEVPYLTCYQDSARQIIANTGPQSIAGISTQFKTWAILVLIPCVFLFQCFSFRFLTGPPWTCGPLAPVKYRSSATPTIAPRAHATRRRLAKKPKRQRCLNVSEVSLTSVSDSLQHSCNTTSGLKAFWTKRLLSDAVAQFTAVPL